MLEDYPKQRLYLTKGKEKNSSPKLNLRHQTIQNKRNKSIGTDAACGIPFLLVTNYSLTPIFM